MIAQKLLFIISISIWSAFVGFAYAQTQPSRPATSSQAIPAEWLKEFPTATKEQRKVWPREKKEAWMEWKEAEIENLKAKIARDQAESARLDAKNEKLKRDNEILGSVAGRLKGVTPSEKK